VQIKHNKDLTGLKTCANDQTDRSVNYLSFDHNQ
jgi:hypothetical protein